MKPKLGYWSLIALMLLTGCLPSLNPVYTEKDLIFDPALVGQWKQPTSTANWEFSKSDEKSYKLVYTDEAGHSGLFTARLAKIQGLTVLDLFPQEIQNQENTFYKFHLVPIHTIYVVRKMSPEVEIAAVDYEWLENFLAKQPEGIAHATFNGRKLITASTADLQAFLLQHQDAFKEKFVLQRETTK